VQVDPFKPKLKLLGTKRLKLKCDILLSTSAFNFNLRRYTSASYDATIKLWDVEEGKVGWCRFTLSNPH